MLREVLSQPFPLLCRLVFRSRVFVSRLCVVPRLCARRCLVQIPREALLHKPRSVIKFCDILSIHCFQLACVVLVCFSSVPWLRCLCTHIPNDVSSHLANQKHVSSCLISSISSTHHKCHPAERYFHTRDRPKRERCRSELVRRACRSPRRPDQPRAGRVPGDADWGRNKMSS